MLKLYLHRVIAGALIVLLPAAMVSAEAGTAMLSAGDKVLVNGIAVKGRQAILPGDTVRNAGETNVVLAVPGAAITLARQSAVTYQDNSILVTAGAARFKSSPNVSANYQEISVRPSTDNAQFVVGEVNGKRIVAALHGSILVSDGTTEVLLPEGNAMTQDKTPEPAAQGRGVGNGEKKSDDSQRGGKRRAGMVLPGWAQVAVIGGAVAGVFGGMAAAGVFDKESSSSSVP